MKSKSLSHDGEQPWPARSCRIPHREQSGSASLTEICTTRDTSLLSTAGRATTTSMSETDTAIDDGDSARATRMNLCALFSANVGSDRKVP